jgi:hypothetical protein
MPQNNELFESNKQKLVHVDTVNLTFGISCGKQYVTDKIKTQPSTSIKEPINKMEGNIID